ncbi:potentiating neddylation domain-containing protein [Halteromyces radiatus]|uniref:potentiating neddylation domain-containing protein n=1 Tax=Halteromyces radiatus TaxID=101107 RepID=UPI00221E8018|nr:potentiating neddylation domain-containing protein [Halteromyces radiatus]KAI8086249.1 potentiating neddylation domain-containing protein [Halteromyces radiatus]
MDVDIALALWTLLLGDKYKHIPTFIEFMNISKPVKVINKDQWSSLLDFIRTVPYDLQDYDSTSSWPVLFDDYANWRVQNMKQ